MSDMSSLSHNYASTTNFSHHLNKAVLLLKKKYLGSGKGIADSDFAEACALVAGMVRRLLERMGASVGRSD